MGELHQLELPGALDGFEAVVHPQLAIDAFGVGLECAERDEKLVCDLRTGEAAGQKAEHIQLALAERFQQRGLLGNCISKGPRGPACAESCQQPARIHA